MTEKEFNLSEKGFVKHIPKDKNILQLKYLEEDVKEFIRRRNRLDSDLRNNRITWSTYLDKRRKLAGDKLAK